jgi:hypothetical protein
LQPVPQRQALLQAHRSPQLQRSTATPAHPQDFFAQRHSFGVWFSIGFSWFAARSVRAVEDVNAAPSRALHLSAWRWR